MNNQPKDKAEHVVISVITGKPIDVTSPRPAGRPKVYDYPWEHLGAGRSLTIGVGSYPNIASEVSRFSVRSGRVFKTKTFGDKTTIWRLT